MNLESVREYCLSKLGAIECLPFDDTTLVFKVSGKMFALLSLESGSSINLKCDPEKAIELREQYSYVIPGYHMSKQHWNTVFISEASDRQMKEWIDHSYELIVSKLSKAEKEKLKDLNLE